MWALLVVAAGYRSEQRLGTSAQMEALAERKTVHELAERLDNFGLDVAPEHEHLWLGVWLRYVTFAFLLKVGALTSSVIATLSPLRVVFAMKDARSTLTYAPYPFFMIFGAAFQWCIYGSLAFFVTHNYGFLILVYSNCFGVVMGVYYSYTYFTQCSHKERLQQFKYNATAVFATYMLEMLAVLFCSHTRVLFFVGTMSASMSVLVTAAPMGDLSYILKTRDISSIPSDVVLCGLVCSSLWLCCALMLRDMWILVPNFLGLILGTVQLMLLVVFDGLGNLTAKLPVLSFYNKKKCESVTYGACATEEAPESPKLLYNGMGSTGGAF